MCARFQLTATAAEVAELFSLDLDFDWAPRQNLAPTDPVLAVVRDAGRTHATTMRWGLIPFWSDDAKVGAKMINARCETMRERPAFRGLVERRRCLIPTTGFYEWREVSGQRRKQAMLFRLRKGGIFAMAGLWDAWKTPEGDRLETCTVLTCAPNELVAPIHNRMPCVVGREGFAAWLDPEAAPPEVDAMLRPFPDERMEVEPVAPLRPDPPTGSLFD